MTGPRGELPILPVGMQVVTTTDLRGEAGGVRVPCGALGTIRHESNDLQHGRAWRPWRVGGLQRLRELGRLGA